MQKLVVSRDDSVYEAFADIAQAPDGTLVCTYREAMAHVPPTFSRIVVRRSEDGGYTWLAKQVLIEKTRQKGQGKLNCPRITACADGTLLLIVDHILPDKEELDENPSQHLLFRSSNAGRTWEGPQDTGITDGVVPSIKELSNGDLLVGVQRGRMPKDIPKDLPWAQRFANATIEQTVYRSQDKGHLWEGPFVVPCPPGLQLNEGDFAELDDGTIVVYMREDKEGLSGWKSISTDGGRSWSQPFRSEMHSCLGRPSVGRLRSGEIVVTYRFLCGKCTSLALYVETPEEAARHEPVDPSEQGTDYRQVRFAFIDNDRNLHPDSGYSGWVQLPSGDLYIVDYINDDAPRAQIRGYLLGREDWFLFPEGAIPWVYPGPQPYVDISADVAREQHLKNLKRDWSKRVPTQK